MILQLKSLSFKVLRILCIKLKVDSWVMWDSPVYSVNTIDY